MADITNPESLKGALRWKEVIEESSDPVGGKNIPIILLQNKFDLLSEDDPKETLPDNGTSERLLRRSITSKPASRCQPSGTRISINQSKLC